MKRILGAAMLLGGLVACGGGGGNPKQFVVSFLNPAVAKGAAAACDALPDPSVTTTRFRTDSVFTIYQGDKDHWYLDGAFPSASRAGGTERIVAEGTKKDSTYTFKVTTHTDEPRVSFIDGSKQGDYVTDDTLTVTLTVDGSKLKGSYSTEDAYTCKETATGFCSSFTANDCVYSGDLEGEQLPDPEFKQVTNTPGAQG